MIKPRPLIAFFIAALFSWQTVMATDYFVNSVSGNDENAGTSPSKPFRSLAKVNGLSLKPGDRVLFTAGQEFHGELILTDVSGEADKPIVIAGYTGSSVAQWGAASRSFKINAKGKLNGILIKDCSYVIVKHAIIEADGHETDEPTEGAMRVGVMIKASTGKVTRNIHLDSLEIKNIYYENKGYMRGADEVRTENGTQRYGWGIRLMAEQANAQITQIDISNCKVRDVCHTGIKLTGINKNIHWVRIFNNDIAYTGGPGIQMSEVKNVHVHHNTVDHSGSNNDSRKWGRGSGLWTWSASQVLIEHNRFTNANGPGDSAGAHVDYNCDHIVLQYNFSANNAGGFCEILGNNYNCAYRYNISVNDGHRIKGENGAFQEGKTFWLSGYQGMGKPRKGPVNSYFYNNTIYVDTSLTSRVAIDATSKGILIANNIFCVRGSSKLVLGDQYKADDGSSTLDGPIFFENNLWYSTAAWPADAPIKDMSPIIGDARFKDPGGLRIEDYQPGNIELIQNKGVAIQPLPGDFLGLLLGMENDKDILGNKIGSDPHIGAIAPK